MTLQESRNNASVLEVATRGRFRGINYRREWENARSEPRVAGEGAREGLRSRLKSGRRSDRSDLVVFPSSSPHSIIFALVFLYCADRGANTEKPEGCSQQRRPRCK